MDWKQLLRESESVEVVESGMLGAVEWKRYANGLLTFCGQGPISNFLYELTYPGYHDEDHTEYYPYWKDGIGKETHPPVKYVYINEGITEIADGAFKDCCIEEINIPKSVTIIGAQAFFDNNLKEIELPNNLESIGYGAFEKSRKLKSIFIPKSVKQIGKIGGKYVSSIEEIIVDGNNKNYVVENSILYTADMTQLLWCPTSVSGTLHIPPTVNRVEQSAFDCCKLLKEVIFSETPITLGSYCFNHTALNKLVLPKEVVMEHYGIFGCGFHEHPVTCFMVPCESDSLTVYIDKDCSVWDYFKKNHIHIEGEPVEYNYPAQLVDKKSPKSENANKKKGFFARLFGR